MLALLFLAACFLAYSNGANDNFKGVASLFGSRTCNHKSAIRWATVTTSAVRSAPFFWRNRCCNASPAKAWFRRKLSAIRVATGILLSWVLTVPCAALTSGLVYWLMSQ